MTNKPNPSSGLATDQELLSKIAAGHDSALDALMDRYDKLVRFTVYRCSRSRSLQDPNWLDGIASEVWSSLVFSVRRREVQSHQFRTYLIQITRFKTIDAIRRSPESAKSGESGPVPGMVSVGDDDSIAVIELLDQIECVRKSMARLSEEERAICSKIDLIVDRRWREAGQALGLAESTLRSRWPKILERLRGFMNLSDT